MQKTEEELLLQIVKFARVVITQDNKLLKQLMTVEEFREELVQHRAVLAQIDGVLSVFKKKRAKPSAKRRRCGTRLT